MEREESFCELLEQYLDSDEINKKITLDDEYEEMSDNISSDSPFTIDDTITINDFVNNFLMIKCDASNLYHCGLKYLKCPYVVGVANDFANKNPELVKQGKLLLVTDGKKRRGTYVNPVYLRKVLGKEDVEKEFELFTRQRIQDLEKLDEFYSQYIVLRELVEMNQDFYNLLAKQNKLKNLKKIKKYEEMGEMKNDEHKGRQKIKYPKS